MGGLGKTSPLELATASDVNTVFKTAEGKLLGLSCMLNISFAVYTVLMQCNVKDPPRAAIIHRVCVCVCVCVFSTRVSYLSFTDML